MSITHNSLNNLTWSANGTLTGTGSSTTCTTMNPFWSTTPINWGITTPSYNGYQNSYAATAPENIYINQLKCLNYYIKFDKTIDSFEQLENNVKEIKKNKFLFNCDYVGNRIQPYELIMKLIRDKTKFSVNVEITNVLSISYTNMQFIEIENNLNFDSSYCDFSKLKVKFIYDSILYENHKLTEKELRVDKLKKIMETENEE